MINILLNFQQLPFKQHEKIKNYHMNSDSLNLCCFFFESTIIITRLIFCSKKKHEWRFLVSSFANRQSLIFNLYLTKFSLADAYLRQQFQLFTSFIKSFDSFWRRDDSSNEWKSEFTWKWCRNYDWDMNPKNVRNYSFQNIVLNDFLTYKMIKSKLSKTSRHAKWSLYFTTKDYLNENLQEIETTTKILYAKI